MERCADIEIFQSWYDSFNAHKKIKELYEHSKNDIRKKYR